jgi:DNA-binding SARP family transcriptional activator
LEFRVLGELEVVDADQPVALGALRSDSVLALGLLSSARPAISSFV